MAGNKKFSNIEKIQNLGTTIKDQSKVLNFKEHDPKIRQMIVGFINKYEDFKTILNLQQLLSSSDVSRPESIPRPQNPWVLFRKNVSKGLNMSVSETSGIASYLWRKKTDLEAQFWNELGQITKEIHLIKYPDYKYSPVRSHEQNKKSLEKQNNDLDNSVSKNYFEFDSSEIMSTEINISSDVEDNRNESTNYPFLYEYPDSVPKNYFDVDNSEIETSNTIIKEMDNDMSKTSTELNITSDEEDISMSEIDIDMVATDLFQSSICDSSLYDSDASLNDPFFYEPSSLDFVDPYLIEPSFSFIDPSIIDNFLEFSNDT